MNSKGKKEVSILKKITFAFVVILLTLIVGIVAKVGRFDYLEGYMYSIAADIIKSDSTSCDATSCDATSSDATSSDATSSNATSCNATSCNATSSDVKKPNKTETVKKEETVTTSSNSVDEEKELKYEYKNSELTIKILKDLVKNENVKNIVINLDSKTTISKEIFDVIKGKAISIIINSNDNQMIFNGEDIKESKDIDANITCELVDDKFESKEIIGEGIIVNFADNGELPGNAKIRIKITDEFSNVIKEQPIVVYFVNEKTKELEKLSSNAVYSQDGYIEFTINHNSKYVIANEELEQASAMDEDETVTFLESHKMYILIIGGSVLVIIIVAMILIVDKKTKGKANRIR